MEPKTCRVCLVEHDDEIHAATLSIHDWFHEQVTLGLYDYTERAAPEPSEEMPVAS
jgi:hypothetical protein